VPHGPQLSRRSLLGLGLAVLAGCRARATPKARPAAPADYADLVSARDVERALLATYDALIASAPARAKPRLEVERATHAAHLAALHGTTTTNPLPFTPRRPEVQLVASARSLREYARRATEGTDAALFASIAASHEVSRNE
jgi:hypothetical protein